VLEGQSSGLYNTSDIMTWRGLLQRTVHTNVPSTLEE
jgi:hypothetical protein